VLIVSQPAAQVPERLLSTGVLGDELRLLAGTTQNRYFPTFLINSYP
jgi:hypothetical protein